MTTQGEQTQDQEKTAEAVEAEVALTAGYNKINPPADDKTPDKTLDKSEEDPPVVTQPEATPDPWEGVPPVVRQALDGISNKLGVIDNLGRDLKTTAGRVAAMQSALDTAKAAAKTLDNAPSAEQIDAAAKDPAEWTALKDDFPEWVSATEGYLKQALAAERAELLKQIPKPGVDVDELRGNVSRDVSEAMQRARQLARVDVKHENWEQDIRTPDGNLKPEFAVWMKAQAPDIQALADSENANDAIKMLDLYYDHRKAAGRKEKNQTRLAANVAPKSAAGSGPTILPDEAGLSVGYQRMKRA